MLQAGSVVVSSQKQVLSAIKRTHSVVHVDADERVVVRYDHSSQVICTAALTVATAVDPDDHRQTWLLRGSGARSIGGIGWRIDLLTVNVVQERHQLIASLTLRNRQSSLLAELSTAV